MTATRRKPSGRPEEGEYAAYTKPDVELVDGDDPIEAIIAQGETVGRLFESVGEERAEGLTYAPGKWTLKEVLGHMIDDERIFAYRMLCVARGDAGPLPGFDENAYVASSSFEKRSMADLIGEYRSVRSASITLLNSFSSEEWLRKGTVNSYTASVRGLAFQLAAHELHHLAVVNKKYLVRASDENDSQLGVAPASS